MVRLTADAPHGLLVVDKPSGPTSHDIVARARRFFATRSVGHAGTLDPVATGVLLLLFGEAKKLSSYLTLGQKSYLAEVRFGAATDTLDAAGQEVERRPVPPGALDAERVDAALARERARAEQVPPAVSAISVGGRRAHELTRRGTPPVLAPRSVRVARLALVERHTDRLLVEVTATKGYYVRALARDLGEALGLPAHLGALRRTASGAFTIAEAVAWPPPGTASLISPTEAARRSLPTGELTPEGEARARQGKPLDAAHFARCPPAEGAAAWLGSGEALVALGAPDASGAYRVLRGFNPPG